MRRQGYIAKTLRRYDCTMDYLLSRMKRYEPHLGKCLTVELKRLLSKKQRQARVTYCETMLEFYKTPHVRPWLGNCQAYPEHYFIIYIDQKKLYCSPPANKKCWSVAGKRRRYVLYDGLHGNSLVKTNPHVLVSQSPYLSLSPHKPAANKCSQHHPTNHQCSPITCN